MKKIAKKNNFLLLELMLALGLIAGCALPLLKGPLFFAKTHDAATLELELFFLSEKALCEVKESLYNHIPSWKKILSAQHNPLCLQDKTFYLSNMESTVTEIRTLRSCLLKKDKSGKLWAKLQIEIIYKLPKQKKIITKFTHTLTICEKEDLINVTAPSPKGEGF